jgi:hypothetical protein
MPITYRFDDDVVQITIEGDHDVQDFFECVESLVQDPQWAGPSYLLIDVTRSTAVTRRTPRELRQVSEFMQARPGLFRHSTALLVSSSMQVESLSQNIQSATLNGDAARAFFDRGEAIAWLRSQAYPSSGIGRQA